MTTNKLISNSPQVNVAQTNASLKQDDKAELQSKDRLDLLLKIIGRWDFYINSTNAKASLIIAWNGVVFGTLLLKYDEVMQLYPFNWPRYIAVGLFCFIAMASMMSNGFIFMVVFPFLEPSSDGPAKGKGATDGSSLFFVTVAAMGREKFAKKIANSTSEELLEDISDQGVALAKGLSTKMKTLQRSIKYIYLQLILLACLAILLTLVSWVR